MAQRCRDLFSIPEAGFSTSPAVIAEKPFVVKGMIRALLRGVMVARHSKQETLDSILRHNHFINRELANIAYEEVHKEWDRCSTWKPINARWIATPASGTCRRNR
jgi:hypothetical protein